MMTQKAWVLDDADFFVETHTGDKIRVQSSLVDGGVLRWTCECVADESGLCKHVVTSLMKSAVRSVYDTLISQSNTPRKVRFQQPHNYVHLAPFSSTNTTPNHREQRNPPAFIITENSNKDDDSGQSYVKMHSKKLESYEQQKRGAHFDAAQKKRYETEYTEIRNNAVKRPIEYAIQQELDYHHSPVKKGRATIPMSDVNGQRESPIAQSRPFYQTDESYVGYQSAKSDWVETQDFSHPDSSNPQATRYQREERHTRGARTPLHKQLDYEEASNESVLSMHLERLRKPRQPASRSTANQRPILRRSFAFGTPVESTE